VLVKLFIGAELNDLAGFIVNAGQGTDEPEGYGTVGDQLNVFAINLYSVAFLGASGHEADGG
jgi:hypothetical protein